MAWHPIPFDLAQVLAANEHMCCAAELKRARENCAGTLDREEGWRPGDDKDKPDKMDPDNRNKKRRKGKPDKKDMCRDIDSTLMGTCMTGPRARERMGDRLMMMLMILSRLASR
jgi:hypothetical protein